MISAACFSATIATASPLGRETMTDLFNFAMLICASVGSMVFGILAAYGALRAGFALMRPQPRQIVVNTEPEAARVS